MYVFDWRALIPFVFVAPLIPVREPAGRVASRVGSAAYVAILISGTALVSALAEAWPGAVMFRGFGIATVFLLASGFRLRQSTASGGERGAEVWRGFIPSFMPLAALVWTWAAWVQVTGRPELPDEALEALPDQQYVESPMVAAYAAVWIGSVIAYVVVARRERVGLDTLGRPWGIFAISQVVIAWLLLEQVQGLRIGESGGWFGGATVAAMLYFKLIAGESARRAVAGWRR
jgi:hypothetical protein